MPVRMATNSAGEDFSLHGPHASHDQLALPSSVAERTLAASTLGGVFNVMQTPLLAALERTIGVGDEVVEAPIGCASSARRSTAHEAHTYTDGVRASARSRTERGILRPR